jgi:crotonobetainyl-CoA:carnitine CoA-transferase CaiB-like acyl-CoA transferase
VNIADDRGQRVIRELAAQSDVLIENFKTGSLRRYGLDSASMLRLNPALIYCSVSAYGQDGPRAAEAGYDAMIQASAGLMSVTGDADGMPQKVGVAVSDIMAGMYAVTAILAALHARHRDGRGQHIDVPLFDTQLAWLANQGMNYLVGGKVPPRCGTGHPNIVPYQAFATSDGYLMLAVGNNRQFAACATCLDVPDLSGMPQFATNSDRVEHRDELVAVMARQFRTRPTAHWLQVLGEVHVPCGPVNDLAQAFADPQVEARQLLRFLPHALGTDIPTVANPVRFSQTATELRSAPPLLGEHTREVLCTVLGYADDEIDQLRDAGVI